MGLRFIVTASEGTVAGAYMDVVVEGESVVIGRGEVDLVLPDPSVSLRHAEVREVEEGWEIEDLGSRLGSWLNGTRLEAGKAVPIRVGDCVGVGDFRVSFEGEQDEEVENTKMAARGLARRLQEGRSETTVPCLEVQNGPAAGCRLELPAGRRLKLGRGSECQLVVDDARISRNHARIENRNGTIWLEDSGSANGTFLNEAPVRGRVQLRDGSRVRIGAVRLLLVSPREEKPGLTAALGALRRENPPLAGGIIAALALGGLGLLLAVFL